MLESESFDFIEYPCSYFKIKRDRILYCVIRVFSIFSEIFSPNTQEFSSARFRIYWWQMRHEMH